MTDERGQPRHDRRHQEQDGAIRRSHRADDAGRRDGRRESGQAPDEERRKTRQRSEPRDGKDDQKESRPQLNRLEDVGLARAPRGRAEPFPREKPRRARGRARGQRLERGPRTPRAALRDARRSRRPRERRDPRRAAGSHGRPAHPRRIEAAQAPAARTTRSVPNVTRACVVTRRRHAVGRTESTATQASAGRSRCKDAPRPAAATAKSTAAAAAGPSTWNRVEASQTRGHAMTSAVTPHAVAAAAEPARAGSGRRGRARSEHKRDPALPRRLSGTRPSRSERARGTLQPGRRDTCPRAPRTREESAPPPRSPRRAAPRKERPRGREVLAPRSGAGRRLPRGRRGAPPRTEATRPEPTTCFASSERGSSSAVNPRGGVSCASAERALRRPHSSRRRAAAPSREPRGSRTEGSSGGSRGAVPPSWRRPSCTSCTRGSSSRRAARR